MIEKMTGLPDDVLGLRFSGDVTGDDYEATLIPALDEMTAESDKIKAIAYFDADFEDYEGEAMWDDAKAGLHHLTDFSKLAVVADEKWIRRSIKAFGWLMPGKVKLYSGDELDEATAWVSSAD